MKLSKLWGRLKELKLLEEDIQGNIIRTKSTDRNLPVGGISESQKLRSLEGGIIAVKYPTKTKLIDFYGSLKIYELWGVNSG